MKKRLLALLLVLCMVAPMAACAEEVPVIEDAVEETEVSEPVENEGPEVPEAVEPAEGDEISDAEDTDGSNEIEDAVEDAIEDAVEDAQD